MRAPFRVGTERRGPARLLPAQYSHQETETDRPGKAPQSETSPAYTRGFIYVTKELNK